LQDSRVAVVPRSKLTVGDWLSKVVQRYQCRGGMAGADVGVLELKTLDKLGEEPQGLARRGVQVGAHLVDTTSAIARRGRNEKRHLSRDGTVTRQLV
jgi:hypothetical protein